MTGTGLGVTEGPLTTLGLTPYGARVYLALARGAAMTASQAADLAGIPRQRVYDVLEDLAARGLATRCPGKPSRYDAVDPSRALSRLMGAHRKVLAQRQRVADRLARELRPGWLLARREQPPAPDSAPDGQVALAEIGHWRQLAQQSVLATAVPPFDGFADRSWLDHVERLTSAGGTVRCVYQSEVLADPALLLSAWRFAAAGEEARVAPTVPTRMIVADGRRALLPMPRGADVPGAADPVLLIQHEDVVTRLESEFEALWSRAVPLADVSGG